jgi:hypothetical protein
MNRPRFVNLANSEKEYIVSINIKHIRLVRDNKDRTFTWLWLQGDKTPLQIYGTREHVMDQIMMALSR